MKKRLALMAMIPMLLLPSTTSADVRPDYRAEYTPYVEEVCEEYGICPELIEAIIELESSWNPNATSGCGAKGLMQIIGRYQKDRMDRLEITDLTDPYQNILCGVDLVADYMDQGLEPYDMLVAYRYGLYSKEFKAYEANGGTIAYADRVLERSRELEIQHGK